MQRLKLRVFDPPQRALWAELGQTPAMFTLYGGPALALQLGHRKSIDFDFFSSEPFDPEELLAAIPYLSGARVTQVAVGSLNVVVDRGGDVRVAYFAPPRPLIAIAPRIAVRRPGLSLASKIDIAATNIAVLARRPSAKDYVDVHALITKGRIPLAAQLAVVPFVFPGRQYNPVVPLKALAFFGDGDLPGLPAEVKSDLARAVSKVELKDVELWTRRARKKPKTWAAFA